MTSSFFLYQGPGRISIARYVPRGTPPGYRIYKALAPSWEMLQMDHDEYRPLYFAMLAELEPRRVWEDLHALADPHPPVLLCWERLQKPADWCHRRMVAEWFENNLAIEVPEMICSI